MLQRLSLITILWTILPLSLMAQDESGSFEKLSRYEKFMVLSNQKDPVPKKIWSLLASLIEKSSRHERMIIVDFLQSHLNWTQEIWQIFPEILLKDTDWRVRFSFSQALSKQKNWPVAFLKIGHSYFADSDWRVRLEFASTIKYQARLTPNIWAALKKRVAIEEHPLVLKDLLNGLKTLKIWDPNFKDFFISLVKRNQDTVKLKPLLDVFGNQTVFNDSERYNIIKHFLTKKHIKMNRPRVKILGHYMEIWSKEFSEKVRQLFGTKDPNEICNFLNTIDDQKQLFRQFEKERSHRFSQEPFLSFYQSIIEQIENNRSLLVEIFHRVPHWPNELSILYQNLLLNSRPSRSTLLSVLKEKRAWPEAVYQQLIYIIGIEGLNQVILETLNSQKTWDAQLWDSIPALMEIRDPELSPTYKSIPGLLQSRQWPDSFWEVIPSLYQNASSHRDLAVLYSLTQALRKKRKWHHSLFDQLLLILQNNPKNYLLKEFITRALGSRLSFNRKTIDSLYILLADDLTRIKSLTSEDKNSSDIKKMEFYLVELIILLERSGDISLQQWKILLTGLASSSLKLRLQILKLLRSKKNWIDQTWEAVLKALNDSNKLVREAAIISLRTRPQWSERLWKRLHKIVIQSDSVERDLLAAIYEKRKEAPKEVIESLKQISIKDRRTHYFRHILFSNSKVPKPSAIKLKRILCHEILPRYISNFRYRRELQIFSIPVEILASLLRMKAKKFCLEKHDEYKDWATILSRPNDVLGQTFVVENRLVLNNYQDLLDFDLEKMESLHFYNKENHYARILIIPFLKEVLTIFQTYPNEDQKKMIQTLLEQHQDKMSNLLSGYFRYGLRDSHRHMDSPMMMTTTSLHTGFSSAMLLLELSPNYIQSKVKKFQQTLSRLGQVLLANPHSFYVIDYTGRNAVQVFGQKEQQEGALRSAIFLWGLLKYLTVPDSEFKVMVGHFMRYLILAAQSRGIYRFIQTESDEGHDETESMTGSAYFIPNLYYLVPILREMKKDQRFQAYHEKIREIESGLLLSLMELYDKDRFHFYGRKFDRGSSEAYFTILAGLTILDFLSQ